MNWPPDELPEYIGYQEFVCSEELARGLIAGGMTHVNEVPVCLQHMDTLSDGRWIIHVWAREPVAGDFRLIPEAPLRRTEPIAA